MKWVSNEVNFVIVHYHTIQGAHCHKVNGKRVIPAWIAGI